MRFLFFGDDAPERQRREALLARMDVVHREIASIADASFDAETTARAQALVRSLDENLGFEVLAESDGSETLVFSPRGERRLRPLVDAFISRAPARPGRRWVGHHPPRTLGETLERVRAEHHFELEDARARAGFSRGHLIDVVVYGAGFGGASDERAVVAAEHVVESLLGERVLDDWIGQVSAEPLPRGGPLRVVSADSAPTFALAALPAAISRAVEGVRAELPTLGQKGLDREGWTLFEAEPEIATDYLGPSDVALASSALPEMMKCFLEGSPFSSRRFARNGELFAYVKLDGGKTTFQQRVEERTRLEDVLADALARRALGSVVGSALGVRYAYLVMALAPGQRALDLVGEVVRGSRAPERAWILFCDGDWADEWIGVWPDTPPPFASE